METSTTQFSARISTTAKAELDMLAATTGRTRQEIIESAIMHEAQANRQVPDEFVVPVHFLLTPASARRVLHLIDHPKPLGAAMSDILNRIRESP